MSTHSSQTRAVCYYRASSGKQEASVPEQRAWAQRMARAERIQIIREFEDDGIPGAEVERRSGLMDLIAFCEQDGNVNAVLCWDADRLSRADSLRTASVLDRLVQAGATRLLTPEGWTDFESEMDRVLYHLKQDLSRSAYSRRLSKDVSRSALARAQLGRWVSGKTPYGYVVGPDGKLALGDPDEVEIVRWLFRQYVDTADSIGDLASRLNVRGVPGTRKGPWRRDTIYTMLTNRTYTGDFVWNKRNRGRYSRIGSLEVKSASTKRRGQTQPRNATEDVIVIEGNHPAIIDQDTFRATVRKMETCRWKRTTPLPGGGEWVLSGLLYCQSCGGRMVGRRVRRKGVVHRYYICATNSHYGRGLCRANSITQGRVVKEVMALAAKSFTDPERIKALQDDLALALREGASENAERLRQLTAQIDQLDRQVAQGNSNLALLPPDRIPGVVAQVRAWENERDRLAKTKDELRQGIDEDVAATGRVADALKVMRELADVADNAPPDVLRTVLGQLVSRVTIHFDNTIPHRHPAPRATEIEVEFTPEALHLLGIAICLPHVTDSSRSGTV